MPEKMASTQAAESTITPGSAPGLALAVTLRDTASVRLYERNPRLNDKAVEEPKEFQKDYLVFRDGRVYSKRVKRFLKPRKHTHGYLRLYIHRKDEYVHRIVAFCYLDNPLSRHEINHIDGDKTNNHVDNLEWSTRAENNKHAFATGLRDYAELKMMATCENARLAQRRLRKFSNTDVLRIRALVHEGATDRQIANAVGGTRGAVYQIRKGLTYKEIP